MPLSIPAWDEETQGAEAAQPNAEKARRAEVAPQPPHREQGGPKIERLFEWEFLIWAREELRKKYGVSSSALSATQAREQLKGHGYRIWWSVLSGYKVQIPSVHNLEQ